MTQIVVPIRYPLTASSRATLETACEVAETQEAMLSILHVNSSTGDRVSHETLKHDVETAIGPLPDARYVSRSGILIEELIIDEVQAQAADIVVIGSQQVGRIRRLLRRLLGQPDIERSLRERLDCEIILASTNSITAAS